MDHAPGPQPQEASDPHPSAPAAREIAELRVQIARADDLYHNHGRPELTDAEYDALVERLRALEAAHPELVSADSPIASVTCLEGV